MVYRLAVDLGSAWVTAAIAVEGGVEGDSAVEALPVLFPTPTGPAFPAFPAVVFATDDGSLLLGPTAAERARQEPGRAVDDVLLRLGDPTPVQLGGAHYDATELLARLVAEVLEVVTEQQGEAPDTVVLTRPAAWGPYRIERFAEVPGLAGIPAAEIRIAAEVSAQRYGRLAELREGAVVLVCDWGARTFECSLVQQVNGQWQLLAEAEGVERLGGNHLDEALLRHLDDSVHGALTELREGTGADRAVWEEVRIAVRAAREALSRQDSAFVELPLPGGVQREMISKSDVRSLAAPLLMPAVGAVVRLLDSAGLRRDEITSCLLVGGASTSPLLSRLLRQELGRPVYAPVRPSLEVALAAAEVDVLPSAPAPALAAAALEGQLSPFPDAVVTGTAQRWKEHPAPEGLEQDEDGTPSTPWDDLPPAGDPLDAVTGEPDHLPGAVPGPLSQNGGQSGSSWDASPYPSRVDIGKELKQGSALRSRRAVLAGAGILLGAGTVAVLIDRNRDRSSRAAEEPSETPNTSAPDTGTVGASDVDPVESSGQPRVVASRASFGDQVSGVALGSGKYGFVIARASHLVFMLGAEDGVEQERFLIDGEPCFLTLTPDSSVLCVTARRDGPGAVVLIDVAKRKVLGTVPVGRLPNEPGMSPDGLSLHVPCEENDTIWMVDIPTRTSEPQTSVNPVPQMLAVSADGRRGYVPERGSRSLAVLDLTNHTFLFRWTTGGGPIAATASPDGERVYVANADARSVSAVTTGGVGIVTLPVSGSPTTLAMSPDGRHVYVVCPDADTVDVISTQDLVVTGSVRTSSHPVDISASPDGRFAWVACSGSGELNILDTAAS